jgi:hypothetical protein
LAVNVADFVDAGLYEQRQIPRGERLTWTLNLQGGRLLVYFGPGGKPAMQLLAAGTGRPPNRALQVKDVYFGINNRGLRSEAVLAVPAGWFGKAPFKAGDMVSFRSTLTTHSRAERMDWNYSLHLQ